MAFSGMSPDQIDSAASQLRTQAQELQYISTRVSSLIDQAAKNWQGSDMSSFRSAWYGSYRGKMATAKSHLDSMASELNRQATDQRNVSNAGTVPTIGPATIPTIDPASGPAASQPGGSPAAGTNGVYTTSHVMTSVWDTVSAVKNFVDGTFSNKWHLSPITIDALGKNGQFLYPHMASSDWMQANGLPKDYATAYSGTGVAQIGTVVSGMALGTDIMTLTTGWQGLDSPYKKVTAVANTVSDATATVAGVGSVLVGAGKILLDSPLAKVIPGLNIASNIASAVADGAQAAEAWKNHDVAGAVLNGVEALASVASCIPGPIGVVGTVASLGLHALEGVFSIFKK